MPPCGGGHIAAYITVLPQLSNSVVLRDHCFFQLKLGLNIATEEFTITLAIGDL